MNKILLWNFWPPFLGAGIRIERIDPQYRYLEAKLTLHWWNRNYIGTLFGGSIYCLCDAFHMILLLHLLGKEYIVRDKGAEIRFLKKGLGTVRARFEITAEMEALIRNSQEEVQEHRFLAQVKDESGDLVAEVTKILHIRRVAHSPLPKFPITK